MQSFFYSNLDINCCLLTELLPPPPPPPEEEELLATHLPQLKPESTQIRPCCSVCPLGQEVRFFVYPDSQRVQSTVVDVDVFVHFPLLSVYPELHFVHLPVVVLYVEQFVTAGTFVQEEAPVPEYVPVGHV